jgi:hypothetical protein
MVLYDAVRSHGLALERKRLLVALGYKVSVRFNPVNGFYELWVKRP